jgi:DNA helicase-2/ATP-dependent DNA helicase PcrA
MSQIKDMATHMLNQIAYFQMDFKDVAFIARNKKELLEMQHYLTQVNVPSVISVTELLIDKQEILHIIDFAKYLQDRNASLYFAEFLQIYDNEEFTVQFNSSSLNSYVQKEKDAFENEIDNLPSEEEKVKFILTKLDKIAKEERAVKCLLDILKNKNFQTVSDMAQFLVDMEKFKADYSLEKLEAPVNAITLTTAHSSKGREWENVFVSLNDFKYPRNYQYNYIQEKNLPLVEEERRLLFVAVTRAKDYLTMFGNPYDSIYQEVAKALNN